MYVCACVCSTYLSLCICACLCDVQRDGLRVSSRIKMLSYKTADLTQPWRERELFSFVDFHQNKPAHQRKLFKNPQEWQMCSTMGQMSDVWRAVHVFSKYSGITTVYRYNPLVTWNVKDNGKALMLCSRRLAKLPCKNRYSHAHLKSLVLIPRKKTQKRWRVFQIS